MRCAKTTTKCSVPSHAIAMLLCGRRIQQATRHQVTGEQWGLSHKQHPAPPSLACRTRKEIRGEYSEPDGSQPLPQLSSAEPQLLTESLVVITSFVCPNKSLDFDNVIHLRNKKKKFLCCSVHHKHSKTNSTGPCYPRVLTWSRKYCRRSL